MYCIYYGVEKYILQFPHQARDVPAVAMRLCFARALNKLGQKLASDPMRYRPLEPQRFAVPSGANMIDISFCFKENLHHHIGPPFDRQSKFSLQVEIDVHTTGMLSGVTRESRKEYINRHLFGNRQLVERLQLPTVDMWKGSQSSFIYDDSIAWMKDQE